MRDWRHTRCPLTAYEHVIAAPLDWVNEPSSPTTRQQTHDVKAAAQLRFAADAALAFARPAQLKPGTLDRRVDDDSVSTCGTCGTRTHCGD